MTEALGPVPATLHRRRRGYWQAEGLVAEGMSRFKQATALGDPRNNLPDDLREHQIEAIAGSDDVIVRGWMESELTL